MPTVTGCTASAKISREAVLACRDLGWDGTGLLAPAGGPRPRGRRQSGAPGRCERGRFGWVMPVACLG
jgi:hypothetical protein